jgi:hypothetical protein
MARPTTGKKLSFYPVRVDEDVKKAIRALKKDHPTINAGLRLKLGLDVARTTRRALDAVAPAAGARTGKVSLETVHKGGPLLKPGQRSKKR